MCGQWKENETIAVENVLFREDSFVRNRCRIAGGFYHRRRKQARLLEAIGLFGRRR